MRFTQGCRLALVALALAGCAASRPAVTPPRLLVFGEQHDQPDEQRQVADEVQRLARQGQLAALVMEMAERGRSTAGLPRDASEAEARQALAWGGGWPWEPYSAMVMNAVRVGVPVLGGNLPRSELRPAMADAARAAEAAKQAAAEAKAAEAAVATAVDQLKAAKAETKAAAQAEVAAKGAVDKFDKEEANRNFPVSVFISSKTGLVSVRQGFEKVFEMQASIANPEVPLDNFVFTATGWKDQTKTALNWTATEVSEYSRQSARLDDEGGSSKKRKRSEEASSSPPPDTDVAKAGRTLDRIKLPQEAADRIAEVVKPGSTVIVSSYDVAKSETRYRGTDFIVQMPEVVAKITRPKPPKPRIEEDDDDDDYKGGFFFFGPSKSPPVYKRKTRVGSSKSSFW